MRTVMEGSGASTSREEETRRFIASARSSSGSHGESMCCQVSCQNHHLNHDLKHVFD